MTLFSDLLCLALLLVPAWLLARLLRPRPTPLQSVSETLLLSVTAVSIPTFTLCLLTRSHLSIDWLVGVAAILTLAAGGALLHRHGEQWRKALFSFAPAAPKTRLTLIAGLTIFAVFLVNYDRGHFQYACINNVVMLSLTPEAGSPTDPHGENEGENPSDTLGEGGPVERGPDQPDTPTEEHSEPRAESDPNAMNLLDTHGTGQRLGTTAVIAPMVALFDVFGFRLIYALLPMLCFFFGVRLVRHLTNAPGVAIAAAALALLNPYVLKIVILDENVMSFAFLTATLALLVERQLPILAGIAFGAALGIRHVDLPFALAVLVWVGWRPRTLLTLAGFTALAALPCALHHQATYGSLFQHEHFIDEIFGIVPHSFLGWFQFEYAGLLNWPFHPEWVRTPYNAYPTALYYPLNTLAHLGSTLCALALLGTGHLMLRHRRLGLALLAWLLPQYGILAVLENWMDPNKMGVIITLFPLLVVVFGLGINAVRESWRQAALLLVGSVLLSGLAIAAAGWHFPDDARFYEKHPDVRHELSAYYDYERELVTQGNALPSTYFLQQYTTWRTGERLAQLAADFGDRRFRRPAADIATPNTARVTLSLDVSKPLIESSSFLQPQSNAANAIDTSRPDSVTQVEGLTGWDTTPLEVRMTRSATHEVELFLRYGAAEFADLESEPYFTLQPRAATVLNRLTRRGQQLPITVHVGDRLRIFETVCMHYEVLVYVWEVEIHETGLDIAAPRKMFHN